MASKVNDYVGQFANDAAAEAFLTANGYPKIVGLFYLNTTSNKLSWWDGTAWTQLTTGGLPTLSGAGNPNGVTAGSFGQSYYDTGSGVFYKCTSNPSGTAWVLT